MPDPFGLYSEGPPGEWRGHWIGIDLWLFLVGSGHAVALHNWECYQGCFFKNGSYILMAAEGIAIRLQTDYRYYDIII